MTSQALQTTSSDIGVEGCCKTWMLTQPLFLPGASELLMQGIVQLCVHLYPPQALF